MSLVSILPSQLCQAVTLPENSSHLSKLQRLPHPRTGLPSLYLFYGNNTSPSNNAESLVLEVQTVDPHSKRSWFLSGNSIIADGKLLLLTPIDPLFLLMPLLLKALPKDGEIGNFRPLEDILEDAATNLSLKTADIFQLGSLDCISKALPKLCDCKGDLAVYRFSRSKLIDTLKNKVTHLSQPSTIDKFPFLQRQLARDRLLHEGTEELRQAAGIRVACELIGQYIPEDIMSELLGSYDFSQLDAYVRTLVDYTNSLCTSSGRNDKAEMDAPNEKKRKAISQLSKGATKLMKANITGMAKISSFFKKTEK